VAVRTAGGYAWEANTRDRVARMVRILPPERLSIGPNKLWPDYQRELLKAGVLDATDGPVSPSFCARADMPTEHALGTK
jgi:hypothetical protein